MALAPALPHQLSLTDLGTPLHAVTFCIVDLETTGGSPRDSRVTEIGAVKVRGGELIGELQALVDPGCEVPASITALTGISTAMVAGRPPLEAVLPAFLEFAQGTALVAHNARFDTGFLNAGLARLDYPALSHPVVCTAALARRLVRDEVRNCRLSTLAHHFRCATEPNHRALQDARATVEVLHGLLERAGSFGVHTLEDLLLFSRIRNTPLFKARRNLLDGLPSRPGVYVFRSASGEVLYVGKATDLRARVRSYFTSDTRRKIVDLLKEAETVDHFVCPTPIEAAVREARLIAAHRPRFNQRGKPRRTVWVTITAERFPRLSIVSRKPAGRPAIGPLPSRRAATELVDALHDGSSVRRCTDRIGPRTTFAACALAEMGRCGAPCERRVDEHAYATAIRPVLEALEGCPSRVVGVLDERMRQLGSGGRFEDAAATRDRMAALVGAAQRARRRPWTVHPPLLAAARGVGKGRVEVVVVRAGVLVASATCPDQDSDAVLADLLAADGAHDDPACSETEVDLVARWLESPRVRILLGDEALSGPVEGGATLTRLAAALASARRSTGRVRDEITAKRLRRDV